MIFQFGKDKDIKVSHIFSSSAPCDEFLWQK